MSRPDQVSAASRGGRVVLSAQLLLLVMCLIGSFGVLLVAALRVNDLPAVWDPGLERLGDPKDSLPPVGPDSVWNPLLWVFELGRVVAMFVYPVAFLTVILGAAALARARRVGDRKTFGGLVVGTGAWVALAVLALAPYGTQLHRWLLD
ncbi:hypothetical protein K7640_21310 [Micromonospora sp. PLK6-60]|uniref:hypothetical protein n=1 Tax=Micromonospora sp. PLK6-60 TaxID=2873383 RepID=UPI001CA6686E|nr:hypothetical protein [Micromonospora sp. PLK6-60]MBY8874373.1 hypothetical protein [Micromonospora sp. PLK6-60]